MNRKKIKSSSGDMSHIHPYLKALRGQEVTTSKIKRFRNGRIEISYKTKVL